MEKFQNHGGIRLLRAHRGSSWDPGTARTAAAGAKFSADVQDGTEDAATQDRSAWWALLVGAAETMPSTVDVCTLPPTFISGTMVMRLTARGWVR